MALPAPCPALSEDNPFARPSDLSYALPHFADVRPEHYRPAFDAGAGSVSFTVNPAWDAFYRATTRRGANVDVGLELLDGIATGRRTNSKT